MAEVVSVSSDLIQDRLSGRWGGEGSLREIFRLVVERILQSLMALQGLGKPGEFLGRVFFAGDLGER